MPRVAWPIRCSFSTSAKRTCPSPPAPKPMPGLTATLGLARQANRGLEGAERAQRLGQRRPDEHRPERRLDGPARAGEPGAERVAAAPVDLAELARVIDGLAQRDGRGDLDRLERPVVEVRLQLCERGDDLGAADDEADAPAGHREGLRQAVELDRALGGAVGREHGRRLVAVEGDVGVREVVHEHEVVLAREVDEPLHVGGRCDDGRGVVRERDDDDLGPGRLDRRRDRVDAAVGGRVDDGRARESRRDAVDRVGRGRHDDVVAVGREHPQQVREPFLRADRAHDLGLRIDRDAEAARVVLADRSAQLLDAAAHRVAVIGRPERGLPQLLDGDRRRREIGVAEAEVDHIVSLVPQLPLQLVDGREDVGRQVVDAVKLHFQKYYRRLDGR